MSQLVKTKLWKHQETEIERLARQPRVLVAWAMGTGKTLFAVERDLRLREDAVEYYAGRPTLVVAPLNTHDSWVSAFRDNTSLRVKRINPKKRYLFVGKDGKYIDTADVFILHYDVLRLMPELKGRFGHIIYDECHSLQNRKAKRTKAAKALGAPLLTDMSGSVFTTNPDNIWSILNHLKPKTFSSYWRFFDKNILWEQPYGQRYKKIIGPAEAWTTETLPSIRPFYSRVTKEEALPNLPPKVYSTLYVDLEERQRQIYDEMRLEMLTWINNSKLDEESPLFAKAAISRLTRLQQICLGTPYFDDAGRISLQDPSPKIDALMEKLEENPDEQFVVFSQYKGPLRICRDRFRGQGTTFGSFTGDDANKIRIRSKLGFIRGDNRVLLCTIGSGGVGVDGLQHASCNVVFLDRAWSPTINDQAEDRLHRGGQTRHVHITDILARNTIDFKRLQSIEMKRGWLKTMLGDA